MKFTINKPMLMLDADDGTSIGGSSYPSLEQVQQYQASLNDPATNPAPVGEELPGGEEPSNTGQGDVLPDAKPDTHKVKWNGEERELSYEELVEHASKGFDYTQKTQSLAEEKARLREMEEFVNFVNQNEQLANEMAVLVDRFQRGQISENQFQQQAGQVQSQAPQHFDIQQHPEFQAVKSQLGELTQFQEKQLIEQEVNDLFAKYPDAKEIDKTELFAHADKNGTNLITAYRDMMFDKIPEMTKEQMVKNNMKKQISATQKPGISSAGNEAPESPKSFADIRKMIQNGNHNLYQS